MIASPARPPGAPSTAAMQRMSVVFPAPLGPRSPVTRPGGDPQRESAEHDSAAPADAKP